MLRVQRVGGLLVGGLLVALLAGCGSAGGPQSVPSPPPATLPTTAAPTSPTPVAGPSIAPSSGFPLEYAVPCAGRPGADQIIALLWARKILPSGSPATTTVGPLCSGDWQYTAFNVPGTDVLQVLSRGQSGALVLVTAGTDICTATVRAQAPPGIRAVARC